METNIKRKCKLLVKKNSQNNNRIHKLLGIIIKEDYYFIYFKTSNQEYRIHKDLVLEIINTNIYFYEKEDYKSNTQKENKEHISY